MKTARQDADHGDRDPVIEKLAPQHIRIGVELAAPETVGQDCQLIRSVSQLRVGEGLAHRERHAERRKKLRGHACSRHAIRRSRASDNHAGVLVDGDGREGFDDLAPLEIVGDRGRGTLDSGTGIGVEHGHQAIRLGKRQRPHENRVHDGEDREVGADANREREYGHGGEAGIFPQLPQPQMDVPPCRLAEARAVNSAAFPANFPFYLAPLPERAEFRPDGLQFFHLSFLTFHSLIMQSAVAGSLLPVPFGCLPVVFCITHSPRILFHNLFAPRRFGGINPFLA